MNKIQLILWFKYLKAQYYFLTPCSRILLEKLTGFQLVMISLAFYGIRRFITAFTKCKPPVPILSRLDPIHTPTFHFLKIYHNINLSLRRDKWVHIITAWRVLRLGMEDWLPIRRVEENILNKQSRTADNRLSPSLGVGRGDNNSTPYECILLLNNNTLSHIIYNKISACQPNHEQLKTTNTPTIKFHKIHFINTLSTMSHYCHRHFHPSCFSFSRPNNAHNSAPYN